MGDLQKLLDKANAHYSSGEFLEAAAAFGELVPRAPPANKGQLMLHQAVSLLNGNKLEESVEVFDALLEMNEDQVIPNALAGKARALQRLNRLDLACETFEKCLAIEGGNSTANWIELVQCYNAAEKFEKALEASEKGLEKEPQHFDKLRNARIIAFFKLDRMLEAIEDVNDILAKKSAADLRPEEILLYCEIMQQKGQDLMNNAGNNANQLKEAKSLFQKALDLDNTAQACFLMAIAHLKSKEDSEALQWLEKAKSIDNEHWRSCVVMGTLLMRPENQNYEQAIANFQQAMDISPDANNVEVNFNKGFAHYSLKNPEDAKKCLLFVYENDKTNWRSSAMLGMISLEEENWKAAIDFLTHAIGAANGEADASLHFNLAYAYMMLNMYKEAMDEFNTAFAMDPSNAGAKEAATRMQHEFEKEQERIKAEEERQRKLEEERIAAEKEAARLQKEAKLAEQRAKEEKDRKVREEAIKKAKEEERKAKEAVEEAKRKVEEEKALKIKKKREAAERRRKRLEELRVLVGPPQSYRARRPSLDLIPVGNTESNATSYANWYNKKIVRGEKD